MTFIGRYCQNQETHFIYCLGVLFAADGIIQHTLILVTLSCLSFHGTITCFCLLSIPFPYLGKCPTSLNRVSTWPIIISNLSVLSDWSRDGSHVPNQANQLFTRIF